MAEFTPVDRSSWSREPWFAHYFSQVPCTYSMTVSLDITPIRQRGCKLYPAMLYCLSRAVNARREFRMSLDGAGQPGYYDIVHPAFTVFHRETETFSNLWCPYDPDVSVFFRSYEDTLARWGSAEGFAPQDDTPPNTFPVSMIPWASFTGFNLNLQRGYDYLPPIFTMGRFQEEGGRTNLPLAIQVHHAVCDGFHLSRLVADIQALIDSKAFAPAP